MGFLADVGRSQVGTQAVGFLKDVESIKGARLEQDLTERKIRAADLEIKKAEETERKENIWRTSSEFRQKMPNMDKDVFNFHVENMRKQGYEFDGDATQAKNWRSYFRDFLPSTEGKGARVTAVSISENNTKTQLADVQKKIEDEFVIEDDKKRVLKPDELEELSTQEQELIARESIIKNAKKNLGIDVSSGTRNREQTKIEFATSVAQSKLDRDLTAKGQPNRPITQAEVGAEYEDIYGESVPETLAKAGGKSVISISEAEFKDFGKQIGESDREVRKNLKSFQVIDAGLNQLEKGIISGTFAKAELAFKKALSKVNLVNPETKEQITNTESYAGLMGIRVGEVIRLFGAGTGLSDADREFAQKIAAGEITLDATSLRRLQILNKQVMLEEAIIHNELISDFNLERDDRGMKPSIRKQIDLNRFLPDSDGEQIDEDNARLFLSAAKGDKEQARALAQAKGWKF